MKIGFDAKRALYNKSGLGNYSRNTIHALSKYKPEWEYFLFNHSDKPIIPSSYADNVRFVSPHNNFYKKFGKLWRRSGIPSTIKKNPIDIYHGLSHELPIGIEKAGPKTVVTMHDVIFLRYPELFDFTYRLIFKKKYAHACKVADRIVAITEQTKRDVMEYFNVSGDKIDVVYQDCHQMYHEDVQENKIKEVRKKYNLPQQFILYVGTIEERKNLLAIFEAIFKGNLDITVVAVGRATKYLDTIKQFNAEKGIQNKAIFLHHVTDDELPAMYKAANMFIYPSLFEGLGIPILEALNVGVPIITSTGGCFPEIGGDAAHYVDYGNVDQMIHAIESISSNTHLRETMIKKGLKQAATFNEADIVNDLVNVYKKVL